MKWDDISPDLLAFVREPFEEEPESDDIPEPESMRRRREMWASLPARRWQTDWQTQGSRFRPPASVMTDYAAKRLIDLIAASLALLIVVPLVLFLMLLIRFGSRGAPMYCQRRAGRGGQMFNFYKLRTMYSDAERHTGPRWSSPGDPRVTWVGKWLRRTGLDELPQFWNIILGDMSLVGPRPERPEFISQLQRSIPRYEQRLMVRPGLTGLAQIMCLPETSIATARIKSANDQYYVAHMGFWMDVRIVLATPFRMVGVPSRLLARVFALPRIEMYELDDSGVEIAKLPGKSATDTFINP